VFTKRAFLFVAICSYSLVFSPIFVNIVDHSAYVMAENYLSSTKVFGGREDKYSYSEGDNGLAAPHSTSNSDSMDEWLSDREIICRRFQSVFGEYPNLKNPTTFSEKIIYKELYDRRPILTQVADKIKVRDYVKSRIGSNYLTEVYQIAQTPEEINWDRLPPSFVVKTNHGSGWNIFAHDKNKLDIKATVSLLSTWINTNYYDHSREWCYKNIPRLVFVEEMLQDDQGKIPTDWKFFVFSGKARFLQVNINRFENNQCNFYDRNLDQLKVRYLSRDNFLSDLVFPSNIDEMFDLAERLGEGFDFIRVDLYNVNGRIIFGELTNYPFAGIVPFEPREFDKQFGEYWTLPKSYGE
jgi:hypothetical protein